MLNQKDLEGLPPELIAELSTKSLTTSGDIITSIRNRGTANIDQIMIDIYRATGKIKKRQNVRASLFYLAKTGMIVRVPKRQGVYQLPASKEKDQ